PPPRPGIDRSCLTDYRQWPFILPIMRSRQLRQRLDDGAIGDQVQLLASFTFPLQRPTDDIRMNRAEIVVFAAEHSGRAIYAEKAMAASLDEADVMVAACEEHGVFFNMGTNRRWDPGRPHEGVD
ncbi:MAG: hypothetical protein VCF24_27085, partial [Candidatus Latescibacterota bacterium]